MAFCGSLRGGRHLSIGFGRELPSEGDKMDFCWLPTVTGLRWRD
jgi:hypothetical protein